MYNIVGRQRHGSERGGEKHIYQRDNLLHVHPKQQTPIEATDELRRGSEGFQDKQANGGGGDSRNLTLNIVGRRRP